VTYRRKTVANTAIFEGLGLHSGVPVTVNVNPGSDGIHFRCNSQRVQARPENVTDTTRCTRLGEISTIEHLMSALAGLEITDAEIELTEPELPALDGCAKAFYDGLSAAGSGDLGEGELDLPYARLWHKPGTVEIAIGQGTGRWG